MKKTVIVIGLMMALPVFAQTAVTAPSAPSISSPVTASPNASTAALTTGANRVYLDQSGDNPNVNIIQTGNGNSQGTSSSPVYLRGIGQTLILKQVGDDNEMALAVRNDSTGQGVGATVTIQQLGNTNVLDAACGYGTLSNGSTALTGCNSADLNWKFTGDRNNFQFRGTGSDIKSAATISGSDNIFRIDVNGDKHTQTLKVSEDSNEFNLSQSSTGSAGSSILIDHTGGNSVYNVSQSGTIDNVLSIKSISNSGTFNINQRN